MTTIASVVISDLRDLLEDGARRARATGRKVIVSHRSPFPALAPLDTFQAVSGSCRRRWYWCSPNEEIELAGIGAAHEISAHGPERFQAVQSEWERLVEENIVCSDLDPGDKGSYHSGAGPQIFGGFSFHPSREDRKTGALWEGFPDACFVLPELMVGRKDGRTCLTVNQTVDPATDPARLAERIERNIIGLFGQQSSGEIGVTPLGQGLLQLVDSDPAAWNESVRAVVDAIKQGRFNKAVLARSVRVDAPLPFDAARILRVLGHEYPMCYRFAFQLGDRCFIGSTPELLAARNGREIQSMALAGSAPRGKTQEEDNRLGASLLADEKNLGEHSVVVDAVRAALEPICDDFSMPEHPGLFKLPNVQHLYIPCRGTLRGEYSVVELARRLHPTPAVGGHPLEPALRCIADHEAIDRGWYAGPIGVVDPEGDGAFAVAIRSALLNNDRAHLFAGCGIVEGSDPEAEFQESRLKLVPIMSSLERSIGW